MMNRRRWLQLMALAPFMAQNPLQASPTERPNVLFIAIDDLNDWLSILGHPYVKTPNMERLVQQGLLFKRAYTPGPICNVSRTAILSGLYPHRTGIYTNQVPIRLSPVLKNHVTLPEYFKQNGYRIACGGKVFHKPEGDLITLWDENYLTQLAELERGVDISLMPEDAELRLQDVALGARKDWGVIDANEPDLADSRVVTWATQQLNQPLDKPLFLAVGIRRPHLPLYMTQKYFDLYPDIPLPIRYLDDLQDLPPIAVPNTHNYDVLIEAHKWKEVLTAYLACISYADAKLGELLDGLAQSLRAQNTLIVLWSDHGILMGQKDYWGKSKLWNDCLHVPLIFAGLEGIPVNQTSNANVSTLDIYKTLIELCGLPAKPGLDGQSLVPLFENPQADWNYPVLSAIGYQNFSVQHGNWHYIRYSDGAEELYDNMHDPHEWTNLAQDETYRRLKLELSKVIPLNPAQMVRAKKTETSE